MNNRDLNSRRMDDSDHPEPSAGLTRRELLKRMGTLAGGTAIAGPLYRSRRLIPR